MVLIPARVIVAESAEIDKPPIDAGDSGQRPAPQILADGSGVMSCLSDGQGSHTSRA